MKISQLLENQKDVIKLLTNSKQKDKLVHAYIFEGEDGVGTYEAALYFSMMMLCNNTTPCLNCSTCNRILNNEHSNVQIINPINGVIKKEQITDVIKEFSMSGLEEGPRIYIINQADKLNVASSNALLKFLEEPVPNRYAIILTSNHNRLLDTINSRCQLIRFKSLSKDFMINYYKTLGVNEDVAYILSNLTSDYEEAQNMIKEGVILDIIDLAKKVNDDRNKKRNPYISFYQKAQVLEDNKDYNETFISILIMICEERIKYLNNNNNYYFSNLVNRTPHKKDSIAKTIKELEIYCKYQERMHNYVNVDLQYASMFIELEKEVYNG
mgnify:FL=1